MLQFNNPSFAAALHEIHVKAFREPWTEENFIHLLQLPTTLGWMDEHGFLLVSDLGDTAEILTFAVLPEFQRQGIGSQLMQELLSWVKNNHKQAVFLEVAADNNPALSLYKKMGFVISGKRPAYYKRGASHVDAICMKYPNE